MRQVWFSAGRDSEWSNHFRQAFKASSRMEQQRRKKMHDVKRQNLNGVGEERDDMSDEEGDKIDDDEELAAPDWRVRAGPRNKPSQRESVEHEATHVPFRDCCAHCTMGRGRTHHHIAKQKSEDESRRPIIAMDYFISS